MLYGESMRSRASNNYYERCAHGNHMFHFESLRSPALCFVIKVCAHMHQIIIMKVCAHGNHMFHFESMRSPASCFIIKVCAHVHQIIIMKLCAHNNHMFHFESMRSRASYSIMKVCAPACSYDVLWKYALTCIKCFIMKECAPTCIILFPYQSMCSRTSYV